MKSTLKTTVLFVLIHLLPACQVGSDEQSVQITDDDTRPPHLTVTVGNFWSPLILTQEEQNELEDAWKMVEESRIKVVRMLQESESLSAEGRKQLEDELRKNEEFMMKLKLLIQNSKIKNDASEGNNPL